MPFNLYIIPPAASVAYVKKNMNSGKTNFKMKCQSLKADVEYLKKANKLKTVLRRLFLNRNQRKETAGGIFFKINMFKKLVREISGERLTEIRAERSV